MKIMKSVKVIGSFAIGFAAVKLTEKYSDIVSVAAGATAAGATYSALDIVEKAIKHHQNLKEIQKEFESVKDFFNGDEEVQDEHIDVEIQDDPIDEESMGEGDEYIADLYNQTDPVIPIFDEPIDEEKASESEINEPQVEESVIIKEQVQEPKQQTTTGNGNKNNRRNHKNSPNTHENMVTENTATKTAAE